MRAVNITRKAARQHAKAVHVPSEPPIQALPTAHAELLVWGAINYRKSRAHEHHLPISFPVFILPADHHIVATLPLFRTHVDRAS